MEGPYFGVVSVWKLHSVMVSSVASSLRQPQNRGVLQKELLWLNEDF